jgi:hypothetical protein
LLIRPGAIGDFIVSLPALEFLRADYTEIWTTSANMSIARFADHACSIGSTGLDMLELGLAPESLFYRLSSFDEIVSWYGANRTRFIDAVANLPIRMLPALPPGSGQNATDFYLAQVGAPTGLDPRLPVTRGNGGFVAIHPFSGSPRKNWPLARFEQLATRLANVQWCTHTATEYRFPDLWDLANWLAGARIYIGNDSGITHLASAAGVPVVALFGPTDPAVWAPRRARVIRCDPISLLTVDEVEAIVLDCLR